MHRLPAKAPDRAPIGATENRASCAHTAMRKSDWRIWTEVAMSEGRRAADQPSAIRNAEAGTTALSRGGPIDRYDEATTRKV
jgi:hypothetical protein